jgi:hypothetical protein
MGREIEGMEGAIGGAQHRAIDMQIVAGIQKAQAAARVQSAMPAGRERGKARSHSMTRAGATSAAAWESTKPRPTARPTVRRVKS